MNKSHTENRVKITCIQSRTSRAWLTINRENLRHNVEELQRVMPVGCELMGIVKANAYGHGAKEIASELEKLGIKTYGVATVDEGVELRKQGIRGDILILGYTDITRVDELIRYQLIQTVIDYEYALRLDENAKKPVRVHIKIDSGMHRIGIPAADAALVRQLFRLKHLVINGIFTHLSVSDSREEADIAYTYGQITRFYSLLEQLKQLGRQLPKVHIQSSYGLLNYPELHCDYARIGIALYGCLSSYGDRTRIQPELKPVMELKARVALLRELGEGEEVGYGRSFVAPRNSRIALLPIGYADGLPRSLSCGGGRVLLHGRQASVISRICMDQLMIDVTDIPEATVGDIVTLIGRDGSEEITAMEVAQEAGSIANELLSRLGTRLERIYL